MDWAFWTAGKVPVTPMEESGLKKMRFLAEK